MKNTSENQESSAHLTSLGWSSFFQNQLGENVTKQTPARIVGVRKNIYLVQQGFEAQPATLAGKLFTNREMSHPVVGDWVLLRGLVIDSVLKRKNTLSRKASGGRDRKGSETSTGDQVIAANLDLVCIVCGLDRDFNPRRIERYLTLVYNCGIDPVIILTKSDLHQDPGSFVQEVESLAFGVPIYPISQHDRLCCDKVATLFEPGRTAALIGSSGAGKSTIINRLYGRDIRTTASVGKRVAKGRHTTTSRDLIILPSGGMVIDNPGIREIGLSTDFEGTRTTFPEIDALAQSCRFKDCSHTTEPGCRIVEAVENGEISVSRLQNYNKLKDELAYTHQRQTKSASRIEKERWKGVSQQAKSIKKRREQW